jgi:uncharacterized protein (DUF305 family)
MMNSRQHLFAVAASVLLAGPVFSAQSATAPALQSVEPVARPDLVRYPYSRADVEFMAGMIPHHAQAVLIAGWAASHGALQDEDVYTIASDMYADQTTEIERMQKLLATYK